MADDWEDWENDDFQPAPLASAAAAQPAKEYETAGQAILAKVDEPDMSKFADEQDVGVEEEPKYSVPSSQPKKKEIKQYLKAAGQVDKPLDDPIEEKLRQQRLVEQADYEAAQDLFGDSQFNLNTFLPKTVKDFDDFATAVVNRYVITHRENKNYKAFLKSILKAACAPLTSTETKDIETSIAGVRSDKLKAEQAEAAAKKGTRKQLNVGKAGATAGLDDYVFDNAGDNDEYDFM